MANASLFAAILTGLLATIFWESSWILPFKLLVVLVHEMWHGFVAMFAGAKLRTISLAAGESGSTLVTGLGAGWGFVASVSAGYLGSAFTGALLLNRGLAHNLERITLAAFALWLWYMSALFTDTGSTAFWTGIGWAALCLAVSVVGRVPSRILLVAVGTLFLWYCVFDLFDFSRDLRRSDAGILAQHLMKQGWSLPGETLALTIVALWISGMIVIAGVILFPALMPHRAPAQEAPVNSTPNSNPMPHSEGGGVDPAFHGPGGDPTYAGSPQGMQGAPQPIPQMEGLPPDLALRLAQLDAALAAADGMELPRRGSPK